MSFFIPFLFSLRDDDTEIRESANSLWKKVGAQYHEEQKEIQTGTDRYKILEEFNPGT